MAAPSMRNKSNGGLCSLLPSSASPVLALLEALQGQASCTQRIHSSVVVWPSSIRTGLALLPVCVSYAPTTDRKLKSRVHSS